MGYGLMGSATKKGCPHFLCDFSTDNRPTITNISFNLRVHFCTNVQALKRPTCFLHWAASITDICIFLLSSLAALVFRIRISAGPLGWGVALSFAHASFRNPSMLWRLDGLCSQPRTNFPFCFFLCFAVHFPVFPDFVSCKFLFRRRWCCRGWARKSSANIKCASWTPRSWAWICSRIFPCFWNAVCMTVYDHWSLMHFSVLNWFVGHVLPPDMFSHDNLPVLQVFCAHLQCLFAGSSSVLAARCKE